MTYVEGFITPVPSENREKYIAHARKASEFIKDCGATRFVEAWGDDVPDGKVTDFRKAVDAKDGEDVLFSWFEYPDKEARDAANKKMMEDPRMKEMGADMPFDGKRMVYGGFAAMLDDKAGDPGGYVDGIVLAVPTANKQAYLDMAQMTSGLFREHGATRVVETWGDDVPDGKVTDFKRAVKATDEETVVYSWIEWPSKEARNEGWAKFMADERMKPENSPEMPWDGQRMFWGGFTPVLDL